MIDPITGAGVSAALAEITTGIGAASLADAYNDRMTSLIDVDDGPQIGYSDWTSDKPSISGKTSGTISDGTGDTPVDAWSEYVESTPSVTVSDTTGGAVSGSKVFTLAYSLMEEHPGTAQAVVKAVAPVAIPIAVAVTSLSQAAGVSVDYANLASDVKEGFTSVLTGAGMIYDKAAGLVTAWKDEWGRILFPKKAFDAISDSIVEMGIGSGGQVVPPAEYTFNTISSYGSVMQLVTYHNRPSGEGRREYEVTVGPGTYIYNNGRAIYACSKNISSYFSRSRYQAADGEYESWTDQREYSVTGPVNLIDGTTGYRNAIFTLPAYDGSIPTPFQMVSGGDDVDFQRQIPSAILLGTIVEGVYPDGTSESQATKYTPSTIPVAGDLATSYDPVTGVLRTAPLVPIHLADDPYDTTGDTTDPTDPTDDDNPGVTNPPIPLPIPETKPSNPDVPIVDPSVIDPELIKELVEELATTLDPQPGQSSGIIPVPPLPGITDPETGQTTFPSIIPESGPGFIHVYNPTPAEFVAFGTWLWVTYADATIDKILNNPFDGVIGAHELYATPNRGGRDNIRSAFLVCPTDADLVPNRYSEIDCGTVIVPEFYGNYLDYSPYSQAYIYLPFIGINEVSIDDIVGHAVNIRYRVDSYSGSCIAMIFVAKDGYQNLCYQFAGSCSVEVPMAGGSQAAIKAGMMQAEAYARAAMTSAAGHLLGGIGSALMGSLGGALSSVAGIAGDYAKAKAGVEAARVANKSSVQHSGQFGASHGAMGQKIPFIIIRNPIQVKVVNYNDDYGFPAHKRVIIGGCTGYLRVREVNVISAHATDEEKAAIEALLKNGVYVS
jgi:hypothetical protein